MPMFIHMAGHVNSHSVNGAHGWKCNVCTLFCCCVSHLPVESVALAVRCVDAMLFLVPCFDPHMGHYFLSILIFSLQSYYMWHVYITNTMFFCYLFIYHIFPPLISKVTVMQCSCR